MPTGSSGTRLLGGRRRESPGLGGGGFCRLSRTLHLFSSPTFLGVSYRIYVFGYAFSVTAKYDARVYLVWTLLRIMFFLRSLYYVWRSDKIQAVPGNVACLHYPSEGQYRRARALWRLSLLSVRRTAARIL